MPVVLAIDTASPVIGLALVGPGLRRTWERRLVRGSDAALAPALAELLGLADPDRVAVTVGPGAFTSLRVGLATALGIALARGLPVVPVDSLRARAGLVTAGGRVLALLDARKGRAYGAWFEAGRPPRPLGEAADLPVEAFLAGAERGFVAVGEGAVRWRQQVEAAGGRVCSRAGASPAEAVARWAAEGLLVAVPPEAVRPHYVRPPDAVPARRS